MFENLRSNSHKKKNKELVENIYFKLFSIFDCKDWTGLEKSKQNILDRYSSS